MNCTTVEAEPVKLHHRSLIDVQDQDFCGTTTPRQYALQLADLNQLVNAMTS